MCKKGLLERVYNSPVKVYVNVMHLYVSPDEESLELKKNMNMKIHTSCHAFVFFSFRVDFNVPMKDKQITNNQR